MQNNDETTQIEEMKAPLQSDNLERFEEMFKAGAHYGYSKTKRHPKMASFIYGIKNNAEIFDLEKTFICLERAIGFVKKLFEENKTILFVGTKPGVGEIIKQTAEELKMPYVCERWIGGALTNFKIIRKRVLEYEKLKNDIEADNLSKYTKKERIKINKNFAKMQKNFGGLEKLTELPAALIIVDPKKEITAAREAKRLLIPIVAILNTDCDPESVAYPVPANDAAVKSVKYIINKLTGLNKEEDNKKEEAGLVENQLSVFD